MTQMTRWSNEGTLKVYWLGGFTFPTGFLTALLQCTARRNNIAIDDLSWEFIPIAGDEASLLGPKEGAYISGMYLEGARWDMNTMTLADANPMELEAKMPIVHFKPVDNRRGRWKFIWLLMERGFADNYADLVKVYMHAHCICIQFVLEYENDLPS